MKAVKRLRALRVDGGEVMMGVEKLWEEKKMWRRIFFCRQMHRILYKRTSKSRTKISERGIWPWQKILENFS